MLLFTLTFQANALAQTPSIDEAISLIITQKKASDSKDAPPFTLAPGTKPKLYPGFILYYNNIII